MEVWIELLANYGLVLVLLGVGFSFGGSPRLAISAASAPARDNNCGT